MHVLPKARERFGLTPSIAQATGGSLRALAKQENQLD